MYSCSMRFDPVGLLGPVLQELHLLVFPMSFHVHFGMPTSLSVCSTSTVISETKSPLTQTLWFLWISTLFVSRCFSQSLCSWTHSAAHRCSRVTLDPPVLINTTVVQWGFSIKRKFSAFGEASSNRKCWHSGIGGLHTRALTQNFLQLAFHA